MAKKKIKIEDLATMIKKGFDHTANKQELFEFRKEFHKRMSLIEDNIKDIKIALGSLVRIVSALEVDVRNLNSRVNRLERKTGLAR